MMNFLCSGRQLKSLVAQVLASVMELTEEVGAFPRSSEELFLLVRDLAMGSEAVRTHLLASETVARLAIFVMREHSPVEVRIQSGGWIPVGTKNGRSFASVGMCHRGKRKSDWFMECPEAVGGLGLNHC